ncbi:MAG: GGDEF domain-containing phosphodiesterase [Clostridia bacterium]|nr:GGDEF domain-containing phosphodiesterase [Clostridia bacterium]
MTLVYATYFDLNIKEHYRELHGFSMQNAGAEFNGELDGAFEALVTAHSGGVIPEGYYARGILPQEGGLILFTAEGSTSAEISEADRGRIHYAQKSVSMLTLSDESYVVFAQQTETGYNLLIRRYDEFVESVGVFELENVLLCNADGLIITAAKAVNQGNLYQMVAHEVFGDIADSKGIFVEISGRNKYLTAKKLNLADYYIIGYTDSQTMSAFIVEEKRNNIFFVAAAAVVSFLGAFFIILFYSVQNNRNLIGSFTRGKYCIFIDKYGKILYRNRKFKQEFNHTEIVSYTVDNNEKLQKALISNGDVTLKLKNRKGDFRFIRLLTARTMVGFRMLGTDITEIMNDYYKSKYDAECDRLTGLPAMTLFEREYESVLKNDLNERACVAMLEVTDSAKYCAMFGARFYGEVLKVFAKRLSDIFKNAVYKDAEYFIIFTASAAETDYIVMESDKYLALLNEPITVGNSSIRLNIKMGLSKTFYPRDRRTLEIPMLQAKQMLHTIKNIENKKWGVFFDAILKNDLAVYESKQAILDLIEKNELTLFFQPQYSVSKDRIIGFEGLARITKRMNISVKELIELAEKNGSIIEIGEQVYRKAMDFAAELAGEDVSVSLNVSPVQLMQEGFIEKFLAEYRKYKLRKGSLAIEITESFLMSSFNNIIVKLDMLDKEGIAIHLDDFGMEYSSMLYLKKLPVNAVKIDREFVKDIDTNSYSMLITSTFVGLADSLGLRCIAEGVETKEQLDALKGTKCDIIQGYYISKAVPKEEAVRLYNEYKKRGKK